MKGVSFILSCGSDLKKKENYFAFETKKRRELI